MSPVPNLVDGFSSSGLPLTLLPDLLTEDHVNTFGTKRADLAVEVLMGRRNPAVTDFPHGISIQIC